MSCHIACLSVTHNYYFYSIQTSETLTTSLLPRYFFQSHTKYVSPCEDECECYKYGLLEQKNLMLVFVVDYGMGQDLSNCIVILTFTGL